MQYAVRQILLVTVALGLSVGTARAANDPRDQRIAIVGAGASGLTAAHTLSELGYSQITIYEREARIGGKVFSYALEDHVLEIGAFWLADYETVGGLAEAYGIEVEPEYADFSVRDADGRSYSFRDYAFRKYNIFQLGWALWNYSRVARKFGDAIGKPGFAHVPSDLYLPTREFAKKHRIEPILKLYRPFWIGCGYAYYETVPALYTLKIMPGLSGGGFGLGDIVGMFSKTGGGLGLQRVPAGYQSIWDAVAADQTDVRLGHEVTAIRRRDTEAGPVIDVTANGRTETYDRVIVSVSPQLALGFLDATPEEEALFSQIQSVRYYVHIAYAFDVPYADDTVVFFADKNTPDAIGHMTAFANRSFVPGVWTTGSQHDWLTPEEEVLALLDEDFADLGAALDEIIYQQTWNYFPHVTTDVLRAGFYEQLEAMQGERGLYFVGGLMNFEGVEHTARYAKVLVEDHF